MSGSSNPNLVELKKVVEKALEAFFQGRDGVLRYQDQLCVPNVDGLRQHMLEESHSSSYSIHPVATKIYHDLREVYLWNWTKNDIAEFVAKCPNCQQVRVEHQKLGGMTLDIGIPIWKWEDANMDFITGLPCICRHNDLIWSLSSE